MYDLSGILIQKQTNNNNNKPGDEKGYLTLDLNVVIHKVLLHFMGVKQSASSNFIQEMMFS